MNKYLVVSYDPDEQQWFYDIVFDTDEEGAKFRITTEVRPYVVDADVFDVAGIDRLHRAFHATTEAESEGWLAEVRS